ncbi:ribonuclease HIII [Staphylococcus condimenti]|uniref:Ribonuclease HIII n=1 Tax=Staphylococcus condimenti TaxID=70255 RepID=A0A143PA23_9STAP|nr:MULTISPECIES: ribonuclease HIII [Staphylococcus]AMY05123.1 ribonuclease HIII [Staphylococcus condimenti]APR61316.1 ribonuclease HIII [Staphylococcus condimenti]MDK8645765.1 ribonuclease HIII [Staphylococcus condimenti]OFP02386.1 ribonuclease HIII [Staphylococcus sp. HMSC065E08]PNZ61000.1 ribonuclease HIII [Staphylococcus condimenti]
MANAVYKLTESEIQQLMNKTNFSTENLPPGMRARTKHQGTTINIYNSGKVMFQGNQAEKISQQLLGEKEAAVSGKSSSQKNTKSSNQTYPFNKANCIGSDEAGSGDYFGPLTVCAAYVSKKNAEILKTLGVDDSKKLTDAKIVEIAEQIITFIPHSLLTMKNDKYNEQQRKGWSQVKMKAVLHNQAIQNVVDKITKSHEPLDYIVIDQFAVRGVYQNYALSQMPYPDKTHFETKGESKSIAIAAASIISRYAFVKHMDQIGRELHTTVPKGASNKVDLFAAKIIEKYSTSKLDSISKAHFKNREKALALYDKKH